MDFKHFFTFYGEPESFNKYIEAERKNRHIGARIKKDETETMAYNMLVASVQPISYCIDLLYVIYAKNMKRDPDSYNFWEKCFLDALQADKIGEVKITPIIPNDGQKNISMRIFAPIHVSKEEPKIEIYIRKSHNFLINQFTNNI